MEQIQNSVIKLDFSGTQKDLSSYLDTIEITDPLSKVRKTCQPSENSSFLDIHGLHFCHNYEGSLKSQVIECDLEVEDSFSERKLKSLSLADCYKALGEEKRSLRVRDCSTWLEFRVSHDTVKLNKANFCKDRFCPLCQWRRSLKMFSQVSKVMSVLEERKFRFLFLTLTVRNCSSEELPSTVQALYDGWRYLYNKNRVFRQAIKGTFKSLEITYNEESDSYHPHFHCILVVTPSYFTKHYLTQEDWSLLWKKAVSLDYKPIVNIQKAGKTSKGLQGIVLETVKYTTKEFDYVVYPHVLKSFLFALPSHRRLSSMSGVVKQVFQELKLQDVEQSDLVHINDDTIRDDLSSLIVQYHWKCGCYNRYIFKYS